MSEMLVGALIFFAGLMVGRRSQPLPGVLHNDVNYAHKPIARKPKATVKIKPRVMDDERAYEKEVEELKKRPL